MVSFNENGLQDFLHVICQPSQKISTAVNESYVVCQKLNQTVIAAKLVYIDLGLFTYVCAYLRLNLQPQNSLTHTPKQHQQTANTPQYTLTQPNVVYLINMPFFANF